MTPVSREISPKYSLVEYYKILIFFGIYVLACFTILGFINSLRKNEIELNAVLYTIILSALFLPISVIIHLIFPKRFNIWLWKQTKTEYQAHGFTAAISTCLRNVGGVLITFPVTNILFSYSLSFYILTFFFPSVQSAWTQTIPLQEIMYREITRQITFYLAFGILFFIAFYVAAKTGDKILQKNATWGKVIAGIIFTILTAIFIIGFLLVREYEQLIFEEYLIPLIKFIIGSLPLGWAYELFIGSVIPIQNIPETKNTGNHQEFKDLFHLSEKSMQ